MPLFGFESPLAQGADAFTQELLRREQLKRQAMLDALKQQELKSQQEDRVKSRELQASQQTLMEKMRTDALDQRKQEHDDALAAVAPPQPGMVGSVPEQFAQPMEQPGDASGIVTTAPTAGGSIYQAERRKADDAQKLEDARLKATADEREAQRTNQNQQNEMNRGMQLAIAHLAHSNDESSKALANELRQIQVDAAKEKLDATRKTNAGKDESQLSARRDVHDLASELLSDPELSNATSFFHFNGRVNRDFNNRIDRVKSLLSLENRGKLKGQGAISDAETAMLARAASSLDLNAGETAVRRELQRIMEATSNDNAPTPDALKPENVRGILDSLMKKR